MLKLSGICCAILLALPSSALLAQDNALAARIDAAIAPAYASGEPGATVIVVKDGQTVLRKAYGSADVIKKVAMTPDMSLRLGSITKQFTAAAIMLLAERGKLSLDDDITRHLPAYPTHGKTITIEHLLTHTSGIPSYTGRPGYFETVARDMTVGEMIDTFKHLPLEFEPGTRFAYNNSGYFLLGAIIEKAGGQSYAAFLEQHIFTPLGMKDTAYEGHERGRAPRAAGHSRRPEGYVYSVPMSMTQPYAAGALVSTVDDLAKWDAAMAANRLLSAASWRKMAAPYKLKDGASTKYGYGFGLGEVQGAPTVGHGGGIPGFSTHAMRLPNEKVYVAVLTNLDGGKVPPEQIAIRAATLAIGKELPVQKFVTLDAKLMDAYVGRYQMRPDFIIEVRREGDKLVAQATNQPPVVVKALADNRFLVEEVGAELRFERAPDGAVNQVTILQGGGQVPAKRLP
jgi:CubicO group peptidase (beta-lactamase class C family)